ncbi:MAG: T9SS type A sorting domain-containing protein, partial [Bacteroidota bacterium]
ELLDFKVEQNEAQGAMVTWSTGSETNHKAFILKHQNPGFAFREIGRVAGKGNRSEVNIYKHHIARLSTGVHYFQLWQEDLDGSQTDHGVVSLEIKGDQNQIWTFTAANGQAFVVDSPKDTQFKILVYNAAGQMISDQKIQVSAGERKITELSFESLSPGIYLYQVVEMNGLNRQVYSGKFVQ